MRRDCRKRLAEIPRFRPNTCGDRFSETAMLAGDEPSSISAIKCAVWAGVHFLLPMRTMGPNSAYRHSFRNEMGYGTSCHGACESAASSCL
jgi:hypothetical protein